MNNLIKVARVVTVPEAFVHFKPLLRLLKSKNIHITLVSSPGTYEKVLEDELQLAINPIEIKRDISLLKDLKSLLFLIWFFRKNKFDIIHSSTPKAGLLTSLAGIFSPGSIRIHTFTGQRWANLKGVKRELLKFLDRLIIKLNTQCYADSLSQIEFLIEQRVARPGQIKCLFKGSFGGIDVRRLNNENFLNARTEVMSELQLSNESIIVLFVGQICEDKGVNELVRAFLAAQKVESRLRLVLIGAAREYPDGLEPEVLEQIKNNGHIYSLGYKTQPERYFSAADIFCLPSQREGFGTVVLEAAACGLPTIGTRIPGLVDAVVHNETGLLVELMDTDQLTSAILDLARDEQRRKRLGANAKIRAKTDFDSNLISELQWQEYQTLLKMRS